jgi:hypothetical protein
MNKFKNIINIIKNIKFYLLLILLLILGIIKGISPTIETSSSNIFTIVIKILSNIGMSLTSDLIMWFTFIAIIWYSYETLELRREAQRQNLTLIAPIVILYIDNEEIIAENIGNGPAFELSIDKIYLVKEKGIEAVFNLDLGQNLLKKGEKKPLKGTVEINGEKILDSTSYIKPKYTDKEFLININYLDMYRNRYYSKIKTSPEGIKLLEYKIVKTI